MAQQQQAVQLDEERFCCSMCLDLLKDPVSVPCGHNYCSRCIEGYWDQDDQRGRFSCPQCRETFNPRPVLKKNTMLSEVVESLKNIPDLCYAGPGDVACDFCTGRKLKAVKTCLQCLVSYCDAHLQPHYQSPAFKNHKLVKASSKLQENICSLHDEVKKVFCHTDQQCICYLCCMEEHKGHDMISAAAEMTERQKELDASQENILQRIHEREEEMKVLHQELKSISQSADRAADVSDTVFTDLITSIQRRRSEVRELIRDQQTHEVSRVEEQRQRVEQEVSELRRRHAELEHISHTEDPIHFLNTYTSLSRTSGPSHPVSSNVRPLSYFENVTVAVSKIRDRVEDILKEEGTNKEEDIFKMKNIKKVFVVFLVFVIMLYPLWSIVQTQGTHRSLGIQGCIQGNLNANHSRSEFLQYSRPITLDPNTAHPHLSLSNGNRKVKKADTPQPYPHHPERFTDQHQVMSREGLSGCLYWEVEWSGYVVDIAVSYKDISRTGTFDESKFGYNDKSWSLRCWTGGYIFRHRGVVTKIPGRMSSGSRIGVYLDHSAGTLSFYNVSDTMTLLHSVHTTFTQPLYAGFGVGLYDFSTVELRDK